LVAIAGSQHPKIDSVKADALWLLNTDAAKRSTLFTPSSDSTTPGSTQLDDTAPDSIDLPSAPPGADAESDAIKKSYHESRAAREKINTEQAQLDLDERKGLLIDLEDARQLAFTALRSLRDALRNTGPRIAAQLAASNDPFECEKLVNAEIDSALASMSVEKILNDQPDEDDNDERDGTEPEGA
jgi:hypothetical protein